MKEKFIRLPEVMDTTGLARSTVWLWIKDGKLPKPIKLSSRVTVWKKSDIDKWVESKVEDIKRVIS